MYSKPYLPILQKVQKNSIKNIIKLKHMNLK